MIRLDRYCSQMGVATRSEISLWCKKWLIWVDNQIIRYADTKILRWSIISITDVTGQIIWQAECKQFVTLLLNKPAWYVCSDMDEGWHRSYKNLLVGSPYRRSLHVAWRLDQDTTWLVVCTNDGDLNHRIISPKHKLIKTYLVACAKPLTNEMITNLESWVLLDDGYTTLPAKASLITYEETNALFDHLFEGAVMSTVQWCFLKLQITEGKYHQVKRMLEGVDNEVIGLHRLSIGRWTTDWLQSGEWTLIDPLTNPCNFDQ